ncbi:hypothetical protein ACFE04_020002 [Oxalis oulophora]
MRLTKWAKADSPEHTSSVPTNVGLEAESKIDTSITHTPSLIKQGRAEPPVFTPPHVPTLSQVTILRGSGEEVDQGVNKSPSLVNNSPFKVIASPPRVPPAITLSYSSSQVKPIHSVVLEEGGGGGCSC